MDNPAAPIPSISPRPAVSSLPVEALAKAGPAESPNRRWFLWLIGGIALLALGAALGVFSAKFFSQSQNQSQLPTPSPAQSPTLTLAPIVSPEPAAEADDPTANWKTYTNTKHGYSFKYHPEPQNGWAEMGRTVLISEGLTEVWGPDSLIIRIEPINSNNNDPVSWWKLQKAEIFTKLPNNCFIQNHTSTIKSYYNPTLILKQFDTNILELSVERKCQEPKKDFRTLIVPAKSRLLKIIVDYAIESEQILSTFKFTD